MDSNRLLRLYQLKMVDMLHEFDEFCKVNKIKYSLAYGSVLGAVRHKGYIPWDDDVDIMVDRDNCNLLLCALHSLKNEEIRVERPGWVNKIQKKAFIDDRECVLCIDILVIDNMPDNLLIAKVKLLLLLILQGMIKRQVNSERRFIYRFLSFFLVLLGFLFPKSFKLRLYDAISTWGDKHKTKYCKPYNGEFNYMLKEKHEAPLFDALEYVPFESLQLPIISKWDSYLTDIYGDYMTPPPEDKRVPVHGLF